MYKTKNNVVPRPYFYCLSPILDEVRVRGVIYGVPEHNLKRENGELWRSRNPSTNPLGISVNFGLDCFLLRIITHTHLANTRERFKNVTRKKNSASYEEKVESVIKASITNITHENHRISEKETVPCNSTAMPSQRTSGNAFRDSAQNTLASK